MRIVGVLLAAGRGARFGGGKLLVPIPAASHGVGGGTAGRRGGGHPPDGRAQRRGGRRAPGRRDARARARGHRRARRRVRARGRRHGREPRVRCRWPRPTRTAGSSRSPTCRGSRRAPSPPSPMRCAPVPRSPHRAGAASAAIRWGSRAPTDRCWPRSPATRAPARSSPRGSGRSRWSTSTTRAPCATSIVRPISIRRRRSPAL